MFVSIRLQGGDGSGTVPDGIGRYTYASKNVYDGYFKNGNFDGEGTITFPEGMCCKQGRLPINESIKLCMSGGLDACMKCICVYGPA